MADRLSELFDLTARIAKGCRELAEDVDDFADDPEVLRDRLCELQIKAERANRLAVEGKRSDRWLIEIGCWECDGAGAVSDDFGRAQTCDECDGAGTIDVSRGEAIAALSSVAGPIGRAVRAFVNGRKAIEPEGEESG